MPKPGQMTNVANPAKSASSGVADAMTVGRMSRQTPATTQTASMDPRRMAPANAPAGPSGKAEVEVSGVMEEQGRVSDTHSTGYNYKFRKKIFS